ncbi:MAG: xanthine dehydrogenase family protein molybdopterin-binding subunit [Alphaproteobacteria bacterium]|nr:xanthine dehydrogenase family protein molybdopterin-binding subunit [Alphaproteobacteria bacterium]
MSTGWGIDALAAALLYLAAQTGARARHGAPAIRAMGRSMSFLDSRQQVAPQGIGKPLRRREDARFLIGAGQYADDVNLPGQAYAYVVRSPHAHARIAGIDFGPATGAPGILAVLTGGDAAADGLQPIPHRPVPTNPHEVPLRSRDGSPFFIPPHPVLAMGKTRYVGEPVAVIIAETLDQAMDAVDYVAVDYVPLPPAIRSADALAPGAPLVWEEHGTNLCVDSETGDKAATELAFAEAAHVVRLETAINRVTGVPMELRAAVGVYDEAATRYTVYTSAGGGVVRQRDDIAAVLGVSAAAIRVVSGDIGGNFGIRNNTYPELALVAWAARRIGRPVKWLCERRDAFAADFHGRDLTAEAELALDKDGRFLALRALNTSNLGASAISFVPLAKGISVSSSVYDIPSSHMRGRGVATNTSPTSAYRSAGRPEVMFVLERLIDIACCRYGFDRIEIRRRNLVEPEAMPYRNPLGLVYDSGNYPASLRRAAELGDWAGFEERRTEARRRDRCRGIGIAASIELNTGAPRERAEITIDPSGIVEIVLGTMAAGQGHETSFSQVISEWLGVEPGQVRLLTGDTDRVTAGGGSASARSMRLGSWVIAKAADMIVDKGRRIAGAMLEAADEDIEFAWQRFVIKGTDRGVGLFEVAAAALGDGIPSDLRGPLTGISDETMSIPSYAYTCAVCEIEIDPETGLIDVVRYASIDDCGRAVNPMLIHGQSHGGIAQGIGQALWEACVYDPRSGQLLSGSFLDYPMPRADLLPAFDTEISEVPSTTNPLGMRGGSEGGITPGLAAVTNAIVDALTEFGVEHIELPATPERVWNAIRAARANYAESAPTP